VVHDLNLIHWYWFDNYMWFRISTFSIWHFLWYNSTDSRSGCCCNDFVLYFAQTIFFLLFGKFQFHFLV